MENKKKQSFKIGTKRKKASVIIETIAAIPVLVFLTWAILNLLLYATSASQLNEAANETSRAIAMDLRGHELEAITEENVNTETVKEKIKIIIDSNSFIRMGKDEDAYTTLPIQYSKEECDNKLAVKEGDKNVICIYVESKEAVNDELNYQINVSLRSEYKFSGGWGNLFPNLTLRAKAVSQVELPGRGNYVNY